MTEEFEKKVAAEGVPGEDKKNRCAECLFFESGIVDIYGNMHGTCYNDRVFDVLANSPACGDARRDKSEHSFEEGKGADGVSARTVGEV